MSANKIHLTLRSLMEMKSARDGVNFTLYRLAKSLNMPHSVLLRLIHLEPSKRVNNPRIDTLYKIVEFFKLDGFNITVNDLLMGFTNPDEIFIHNQPQISFNTERRLPLYSFNAVQDKIGQVQIKVITQANNLVALQSEKDIKPIFKKGSIFIIDPDARIENDNLVAVKVEKQNHILIKKIQIQTKRIILTNFDNNRDPTPLNPQLHSIIGVVIQVNAKT